MLQAVPREVVGELDQGGRKINNWELIAIWGPLVRGKQPLIHTSDKHLAQSWGEGSGGGQDLHFSLPL